MLYFFPGKIHLQRWARYINYSNLHSKPWIHFILIEYITLWPSWQITNVFVILITNVFVILDGVLREKFFSHVIAVSYKLDWPDKSYHLPIRYCVSDLSRSSVFAWWSANVILFYSYQSDWCQINGKNAHISKANMTQDSHAFENKSDWLIIHHSLESVIDECFVIG